MAATLVLYVEDEENDVFFMRVAFKETGLSHLLRVVTDGQQAIDYLAGHGPFADREEHPLPGLVLLDLNLPIKSGIDVLRWIRGQSDFVSLPVIVLTSSGRDADRQKCLELGANEFFVKPGLPKDTLKLVETLRDHWLRQVLA